MSAALAAAPGSQACSAVSRAIPGSTPDAVVTMFDSGGSSGVLRDELGVLPPGDILKCALALSRNEREARRVLLARLPTLEHARLGGHTGGNLLLSMMQSYSGDFLECDRRLARASRMPGPRVARQRGAVVGVRRVRRRLDHPRRGRSRRGADLRAVRAPDLARAARFDSPGCRGGDHPSSMRRSSGQGSFYTSLMPIFLVRGVAEALREMKGPVILIANLLTEGQGHARLHRGRRRGAHRGSDPAARRCGDREREVAVAADAWALCTRAQGAARARQSAGSLSSLSAANSGPARSPGTIACAWRTRCGACCRDGCSATRNLLHNRQRHIDLCDVARHAIGGRRVLRRLAVPHQQRLRGTERLNPRAVHPV